MHYRCEAWELDWDARELRYDGTPVHVEPKVLSLLHTLIQRAGRVMTREELQSLLWPGIAVGPDALHRLVRCARVAIKDDGPDPRLLVTRRGHGVAFVGAVTISDTRQAPQIPVAEPNHASLAPTAEESTLTDEDQRAGGLVIHWMTPRSRVTPIQRSASIVLGRAASCDEILDGTSVSREHAVCSFQGPILLARDLKSRNGTYVNGRPVTETVLAVNDSIRIGEWLGIVRRVPSPEDVRFDLVHESFCVGHETRKLLHSARTNKVSESVLNIWGEPGTGKTSLARTIDATERAQARRLIVQCERLADELESDASAISVDQFLGSRRPSDWRRVGTLVLDDIDRLDADRVGSLVKLVADSNDLEHELPRIVTTSTKRVPALIKGNHPALASLACLKGVELALLPLRKRRTDILELVRVFLNCVGDDLPWSISAKAAECLVLYPWPSNVSELRQAARQMALRARACQRIETEHLPAEIAVLGGGM